ncbi:hypothetical protein Tco_0665994 [Tanacetum coccineum]
MDETISIAFIIKNYEIVLRLNEFARILRVPCEGVCMFSHEWSITSLLNCVDPNPIYLTPLDDPVVVRDTIFNERPPTKRRKVKGKEVVPDPFQMVLLEIKTSFRKWETILSENAISLSANKDHKNTCLVYMLYCLVNQKHFNLAYYMANRMASVFKSDLMVFPYAMLLTRLYMHVLAMESRPTTDEQYLVDHVMVPLTEGRAHRFMVDGKWPHSQTSSGSSSSLFLTPTQGEIDPVNNFTLEPIVYCDQLPLIPGGGIGRVQTNKRDVQVLRPISLQPWQEELPVPSAAKDGSLRAMEQEGTGYTGSSLLFLFNYS